MVELELAGCAVRGRSQCHAVLLLMGLQQGNGKKDLINCWCFLLSLVSAF